MIRGVLRRLDDWWKLKQAEERYKLHLQLKQDFPTRDYPLLEEDLRRIKNSLRKGGR
jgi:hypothetical protein